MNPNTLATDECLAARDAEPPPQRLGAGRAAWAVLLPAALLAGCAGTHGLPPERMPHYRCEYDITFTVRIVDDSAILDSSRGHDVLYRDAGGQGPGQQVFSNPRMRAEFGLGASGREAILRYPLLPLVARCVRDN